MVGAKGGDTYARVAFVGADCDFIAIAGDEFRCVGGFAAANGRLH